MCDDPDLARVLDEYRASVPFIDAIEQADPLDLVSRALECLESCSQEFSERYLGFRPKRHYGLLEEMRKLVMFVELASTDLSVALGKLRRQAPP
jgi:hypothetical protein